MKISAKSGAFARALSIVTRAASKKATVPILSAVLVEAKNDVISFKATDNEMSIVLKSGATIEEEGTAAIPAKMLNDVVSQLAEGDLRIETDQNDENGATLTTDKSSYTLRTYDPSEFPALPELEGEVKESAFSIVASDLAGAIARASAAASDDETRAVLCGLFTSFTAGSTGSEGTGSLTMASTDSYRLAVYEKDIDGGPGEDKKAVIPARALSELARLSEMSDTIEVALTENQAIFKIASVVLATRLIAGNFPEYGKLLPDSFVHDFEIPAQALRESLKRANLFSGATSKTTKGGSPGAPVRFAFSEEEGSLTGGRLTISSKSADTGQAVETLDATVPVGTGEFVTAFNGRYVAEGVAQMIAAGAESVRIRANEPLKPIILSPAEKTAQKNDEKTAQKNDEKTAQKNGQNGQAGPGEFTYLIMPMRDTEAEAEPAKQAKKEANPETGQESEQEPADANTTAT